MHPVNRVICFFIFAFFLSHANLTQLAVYAAMLILYLLIVGSEFLPVYRLMLRLRWFFLSIVVLYIWLEPAGTSSLTAGLTQAFMRIALLCLLIVASYLFVIRIPRDDLMACIYWICYPSRWLGLSPERIALRTRLVVDAVGVLHKEFQAVKPETKLGIAERIRTLADEAGVWFSRIDEKSESASLVRFELSTTTPPSLRDWVFSLSFMLALSIFYKLTVSI